MSRLRDASLLLALCCLAAASASDRMYGDTVSHCQHLAHRAQEKREKKKKANEGCFCLAVCISFACVVAWGPWRRQPLWRKLWKERVRPGRREEMGLGREAMQEKGGSALINEIDFAQSCASPPLSL